MTVGIAACGPRAGEAIFRALQAIERVGWGSIGGFVSFAVLGTDQQLHRYQTQRGGSRTLFIDGEFTGAEPPTAVLDACVAALISSGPDRLEPLSQFLPGDPAVGLVTGHRLPNSLDADGTQLNRLTLRYMQQGKTPRQAIDTVLDANPQADVGLIAVNRQGQIYARNSDRVRYRSDLGGARRTHQHPNACVEVLHNAIHPVGSLAGMIADIALETMVSRVQTDQWLLVESGTPVHLGANNRVHIDAERRALSVFTTDANLLRERANGAAIYLDSDVCQGNLCIGKTITEPYVVLEHGRIVSLSGQQSLRIGFRAIRTP